ncbi:MAG: DUF899 domain-containing protein [Rhizobiaceae bacterium]|nr:DUF899 domain-containing protein [Rhizobiaceae bacterium]
MTDADKLELEIMEKSQQLAALRAKEADREVADYKFQTQNRETCLSDLFAGRDRLLMIHNMGQGCRYCTLWADGINGILNHLEDAMSVVLVSKDPPETQRRMALNRDWRFHMVSHGGGAYMSEQCAVGDHANYPGAAVYQLKGGKIVRRAGAPFGPGDLYSPMWHFLSLAGIGMSDWTPQFQYWQRPASLDDGGENIRD